MKSGAAQYFNAAAPELRPPTCQNGPVLPVIQAKTGRFLLDCARTMANPFLTAFVLSFEINLSIS
jgi:hypothetical protein